MQYILTMYSLTALFGCIDSRKRTINYALHDRCCRTYEEVHEGDIGKVVKLDLDGLHDLNVQVEWQRKGVLYWVRYIHIELLHRSIHAVGSGGYTNAGTSNSFTRNGKGKSTRERIRIRSNS